MVAGSSGLSALLAPSAESADGRAQSNPDAVLLDTSASSFGWSGISDFVFCHHLSLYKKRGRLREAGAAPQPPLVPPGPADMTPRDWGTLGHLGLAHTFARWGAKKGPLRAGDREVTHPDQILAREDAVRAGVANRGFSEEVASQVIAFVNAWLVRNPEPAGRTRGVEILFRACLGRKRTGKEAGKFGLWVVDHAWPDFAGPDEERAYLLDMPESQLVAVDGALIEPVRLRLRPRHDGSSPASAWDGRLIWMTRRFDLLQQPSTYLSALDLWDHKCSAKAWEMKTDFRTGEKYSEIADAYRMDEQFCAARLMLRQIAGPLFGCTPGVVKLNHVHRRAPYISAPSTVELEETGADSRFPQTYHARWAQRAILERDVPEEEWEARGLENSCSHKYGHCDAYLGCAARKREISGSGSLALLYVLPE